MTYYLTPHTNMKFNYLLFTFLCMVFVNHTLLAEKKPVKILISVLIGNATDKKPLLSFKASNKLTVGDMTVSIKDGKATHPILLGLEEGEEIIIGGLPHEFNGATLESDKFQYISGNVFYINVMYISNNSDLLDVTVDIIDIKKQSLTTVCTLATKYKGKQVAVVWRPDTKRVSLKSGTEIFEITLFEEKISIRNKVNIINGQCKIEVSVSFNNKIDLYKIRNTEEFGRIIGIIANNKNIIRTKHFPSLYKLCGSKNIEIERAWLVKNQLHSANSTIESYAIGLSRREVEIKFNNTRIKDGKVLTDQFYKNKSYYDSTTKSFSFDKKFKITNIKVIDIWSK